MKKLWIGFLLLVVLITACDKNIVNNEPQSHASFDALLTKYVDTNGNVDYVGFKNEEVKLLAYIDWLKSNGPETTWSDNKQMAYWINLYNAYTIYTILVEHPVNSILDIDGGMVWTTRQIMVGSQAYTLDQIEKNKLLAAFGEPKVHFAVNCAAASCPPLLNKAWTESNIQQYYTSQTKAFINNPTYNTITTDTIEISKIFDWYATDFGGSSQLVNYIQQYSDHTISNNAVVKFKSYNWDLNAQ